MQNLPLFSGNFVHYDALYNIARDILRRRAANFQTFSAEFFDPLWCIVNRQTEGNRFSVTSSEMVHDWIKKYMYVFLVWISRSYFYLASFSKNKNNLRKYTYPALWFVVWYPIQDVV